LEYQQCLIFFLAESSLFVFIRVIIFDTKGGQVRCTSLSSTFLFEDESIEHR